MKASSGAITQLLVYEYIRKDGTVQHRGKGYRLMIYVHSLIWELPSVEITCELTGSGESESIHRDEREQPEVKTKTWAPRTLPRTRPVLGKMTGFRGYQTRSSGGTLFCFLYSNSAFLEVYINGE